MRWSKKSAAIAALSLVVAAGCSPAQTQSGSAPVFPPVPVAVAQATEEAVPTQVQTVGTVEAFSTVEVKAQVAGPLMTVNFTEGTSVNQGDLLFEIDSRPFREALRQAEANVAKDQAQLRVAQETLARSQAQLKNANADAARFEQLSKEGISTRQQEDQIRTTAEVAKHSAAADEASIETMRATLASDQAAVEQAKINLAYCEIHAPISGRAGNLLLHAGNLVKANADTGLVVLNQIKPIFVTFGVPERYLGTISQQQARRKLTVDVAPDKGSAHETGMLSVIDNTVDANTGTIRLKAAFDNKDGRLWPGQFVNVVLTLDTETHTIVPSEAVQVSQQGSLVYVVKADQSVEPRPVVVGQTVSGKVIVEKGVAAGETVVTDGQSRLFPGAKISTASPAEPKAN
ncbi:MAG TPA: efflux RND transporter periplasmic adaptor subunit [Terriglobia bacterium]|jgi:multidrug efflux system membrane fusion protein